MQTSKTFTITPFINPKSGGEVFRVSGFLDGKRIRNNWKTQIEATTDKQNLERAAMNLAPLPAITTRLTTEQASEAEAVFRRIKGSPYNLTTLLNFALENYRPAEKQATVALGFATFIEAKKKTGRRELTITGLERRLNRLIVAHGQTLIHNIQPDQLSVLIFRDGSSDVNRSNDYRAFTNFFNWAVEQHFCVSSPMDSLDKIIVDREEPKVFSLAEARKFLRVAMAFKCGRFVPYVALGLFAGLRPTEISRIDWDVIKLPHAKKSFITIGAKVAKMRGRRIVEISENLYEFLIPHALKKTPLFPVNWLKDFNRLKLVAGYGTPCPDQPELKPWPVDVLRHTAISNHLEKHEHEGKTAKWAGNSPDVIHKHYKGLVTKEDADEFWNMLPTDGNVIQLAANN